MPKNSGGKIVRRRADEVRRPSPERLAEIEAIPEEAIDTSDIPEMAGGQRLYRDENGRLPRRRSVVRETIAATMAEREMTNYALWRAAREHCPTITETAIGQFLKGQRSIGLEYLEAIMAALGLELRKPVPLPEGVATSSHPVRFAEIEAPGSANPETWGQPEGKAG
jgi:hypothetical protein